MVRGVEGVNCVVRERMEQGRGAGSQVDKFEQVQVVITWDPHHPQKDRLTDMTENITSLAGSKNSLRTIYSACNVTSHTMPRHNRSSLSRHKRC